MKEKIALFFIIISVLAGNVAAATIDNIEFRRLSLHDGLSGSQVNCIYKDSRGFLWAGTTIGLNRYDGFRFKAFFNQTGSEKSLPNNNVKEIMEDGDHHLWIATSYGYCIFDPLTETFNTNVQAWLQKRGIKNKNKPEHVFSDSRHNLWFGVDNVGCYHYDFSSGKVSFIGQGVGKNQLPKGSMTCLSATNGSLIVTYNDGTLARVNVKTMQVMWINRYIPQHGGDRYRSYRTFVDRNHNYWIYTGERAMAYFSKTHKWTSFDLMVHDVKQDRGGRIWMATDHNGIILLDDNGNVKEKLTNDRGDNRSIPDNTLQCVYIDDAGIIWIGTYQNGMAFHYEGQTTFGSVGLGDVCTIVEDKHGNFWCGTNDSGIECYSPAAGGITHFYGQQTSLGSDIVVSSLCCRDGSLWFGTYRGGLTCYKGGQFKAYNVSNSGLGIDDIWALVEGVDGSIYIGTLGAGLQILNPHTGKFTTYNHNNSGLESDYVSSLCLDNMGNLVIGHSQDLSIMDIRTHKITTYHKTRGGERFSSPSVNQVYCDSRGLIWIATTSGLNVYDRRTDQLAVINMQLRPNNTDVNSVTEDRQGMIWASYSNIVCSIRVGNENGKWNFFVNSFSELDGLQGRQFNKRSILSASNGDIIVGGVDGINIISPLKIRNQEENAKVIFSGLVIFDHPISVGEEFNNRVVLHESVNESRHLKLDYYENAFSIQLASSNLGIPESSRFMYRLKGFNDRWMVTTEGQSSVTFTNLASGDYKLEVRVVDNNGNAISPVSQLDIDIASPFYLSTWAYLIYILIFISIIYYVPRTITRRRKDAQRRKVDKMKQVFFINVSHELRTPLSLIISPLTSIIDKESDEGLRKKLKLINRNALKLLEMINQMLDLRRLMVSGEHLQLTRGEIVQFVRGICNQFLSLTDKQITLTFYSSMTELLMNFDRDKFGKIINNLLSNAFKFTPDKGRVDVSLNLVSSESDDAQRLELKVSDNGIGISDKDKAHIFDRFYQAANHANHGGSGIGLNLVREYTLMHGGNVRVTDNPGGGTTFIVTLPINNALPVGDEFIEAKMSEDNDTALVETESLKHDQTDGGQRPSLLLVDDSDDFLEFMTSELCDDYAVETAHNGVEALNKIGKNIPDIILTDVMMPEMDGNQLCHMVKRDSKTSAVPVIMLTARLSEENEMESRECGADDYVTKPFNMEILKMHIRNLLKRNQLDNNGKLDPHISTVQITSLDEKLVQNATAFVEKNLSNTELSVVTLSEALNMSRVNLYRKLLSVTGKTPSEFIRLIRLRHAEQLLMKSQLSISEISFMVGFSNQRYFSKCYRDLYGYMPSQYKRDKNKKG